MALRHYCKINLLSYVFNAALHFIAYTASNDPKRPVVPLQNCHGTQEPSEAFRFNSLMVYAPGGKTPVAGASWQSNERSADRLIEVRTFELHIQGHFVM